MTTSNRKASTLMRRAAQALLLAAALVLPTACENVTCPLNNTVACVYNFYASARQDDGVFAPGAAVGVGDTITISAIDLDSTIVNRIYAVSTVSLPMSFYAEADSLLWTFVDSRSRRAADTIVVFKTSRHHFDDPSCPIHIFHHIDSVHSSHNLIDTVLIASPYVNYDGLENIQVFFRVDDSQADDTTEDSDADAEDDNDATEDADDATEDNDDATTTD